MKNLSPYCHQQPAVISEQIEDHIPQPSSHFCESYCLVRFTAVPGQYSILPSNQARKGWLLDRPQYHQMWINPSPISRFSIGETKKHIKNIVVEWHISRSIQDSTVCFDLSNATLRSFPASGSAALPQRRSAWILDMTDTVVSVRPWHLTYSLTFRLASTVLQYNGARTVQTARKFKLLIFSYYKKSMRMLKRLGGVSTYWGQR